MGVSYDEDLANHIGPESCVYPSKVVREALTGERAGWVMRRKKGVLYGVPATSTCTEGFAIAIKQIMVTIKLGYTNGN